MERLKEILTYFLAAMAMLSLLCAVYEAMNQRLASSGVLAGIFIAAALLIYLPQMETFKAFGVEAKMVQQTVDRAQEILEKVRQASIASAKSAYMIFAWSGRLGGMSEREKQNALDAVSEQLRNIGVKDDELRTIQQPHIELIGYDLYLLFYNSVRGVILHEHPPASDDGRVISEWEARWRPSGLDFIRPSLTNGRQLTSFMKQQISPSIITTPREYSKLESLAGQLYEGCRSRGGYTDEALKFLESYRADTFPGTPEAYYNALMSEGSGTCQ